MADQQPLMLQRIGLAKILWGAVSLLVLSGCSVQALHQPLATLDPQIIEQVTAPIAAPNERDQAVLAVMDPRWWSAFGDPQLDRLVSQALRNNHDLGSARLRFDAELERLAVARDQQRPQGGISGGLEVTRQQWSGEGSLATRKQALLGVSAQWKLDLFGRIQAAIRQAEAGLYLRLYAHEAVMAQVVNGVVDSYAQYSGAQRQLKVLEQQLKAIDASVDTLQLRVDEGLATPLELYRAQALRHEYLAQRPLLQELLSGYRSTLATLLGETQPQLEVLGAGFALPSTEQLTPLLQHPDHALLNSPELLQARARAAQAAALSDQARAALYPDISLSGVVGWLSGGTLNLADGDQQLSLAPRLEWSLLNLDAMQANLGAAQLEEQAVLSDYQQILLRVLNRADQTLSTWSTRSHRLAEVNRRHQFAVKAFEQARVRYEEGAIPYLEFLDAQRDLLVSEEVLVTAQTDWTRAYVALYNAFPGGWIPALKEA